jgi:hypothetical protein
MFKIALLNMPFASYMGLDLYDTVLSGGKYLQAGFPEWFFRQAAIPRAARRGARGVLPGAGTRA